MNSLNDSRSRHVFNQLADFFSVCTGENKLCLSCAWSFNFCIFVNVAVCVTAKNNRLFPAAYSSVNVADKNRLAEYSTVKLCTDNSVWRRSKLFKMIFFYTCLIRCDCGTFYADMKTFDCGSSLISNLIIRIIAAFESQIIVFCL